MRTATIVSMAILLAGCGSKIRHQYTDPSFTPAALDRGGMVVGAVVVVDETDSELTNLELSLGRELEEALQVRPNLRVEPREEFANALTAVELTELLDRYRTVGNLTPQLTQRWGGIVPRYVVFARVERSETEQGSSDSQHVDLQESTVTEAIRFYSAREITTNFDVYDARGGALVWTAQFQRKRTDSRVRDHSVRDSLMGRTEPATGAMGGDAGPPTPPDLLELFEDVFAEFAGELPG